MNVEDIIIWLSVFTRKAQQTPDDERLLIAWLTSLVGLGRKLQIEMRGEVRAKSMVEQCMRVVRVSKEHPGQELCNTTKKHRK